VRQPSRFSCIAIASSSAQHLTAHTLVHLTMLHGLVPDSILPFSDYAIVGQAWSISVEWQFYLIAPLVFLLARRSAVALSGVVLGIILLHSRYWLGMGFVINEGGYFLLGILSYFAFKWLATPSINASQVWLGVLIAVALAAFFSYRPLSLAIWFAFLGAAISSKLQIANPISVITKLPAAQWLGRVSYSIYLTHELVLVGASALLLQVEPTATQFEHTALLMPMTIAGTLALSGLTFLLIERPGIEFGRRLSAAFTTREAQNT